MDRTTELEILEREYQNCLVKKACSTCERYLTEECWFVKKAKESNNGETQTSM